MALGRSLERYSLSALMVVIVLVVGVLIGKGSLDSTIVIGAFATLIVVLIGLRIPAIPLVLFVNAGPIKAIVPVSTDLTVVLAVIVALLTVSAVLRNGLPQEGRGAVSLFVVLCVVVTLGVSWSPVSTYAIEKGARFALFSGLTVTSAWILVRNRRGIRQMMWAFALFGAVLSAVAVAGGGNAAFEGRMAVEGSNTILMGRASAAALLALAALGLNGDLRFRAPAVLAVLLVVAGLLGAGSRGPVLGVVAAAGALTWSRLAGRGAKFGRVLALFLMGMAVSGLVIQYIPQSALYRYERIFHGDPGESALARRTLASEGLVMVADHPLLGSGTASFAQGRPAYEYPHNLFIELAAENGLIALGIGSSLILGAIISAARWSRRGRGAEADWVLMMLVAGVVNALVSSDINGHRTLYMIIPLAFAVLPVANQASGQLRAAGE